MNYFKKIIRKLNKCIENNNKKKNRPFEYSKFNEKIIEVGA